jgi:hypothetical protein
MITTIVFIALVGLTLVFGVMLGVLADKLS